MKRGRKILHGVIFIAAVAAIVAVIMLTWNAVIPAAIGWQAINYWQAACLLILCRLLFGRFGRHRHPFSCGKHGHGRHLHEQMKGMSREEKREFIRKRLFEDKNEADGSDIQ